MATVLIAAALVVARLGFALAAGVVVRFEDHVPQACVVIGRNGLDLSG